MEWQWLYQILQGRISCWGIINQPIMDFVTCVCVCAFIWFQIVEFVFFWGDVFLFLGVGCFDVVLEFGLFIKKELKFVG